VCVCANVYMCFLCVFFGFFLLFCPIVICLFLFHLTVLFYFIFLLFLRSLFSKERQEGCESGWERKGGRNWGLLGGGANRNIFCKNHIFNKREK